MSHALTFDLETTGSDRVWTDPPGSHVRLAGWARDNHDPVLSTSPNQILDLISATDYVIGHNILHYDLPVLTRHHNLPRPWDLIHSLGTTLHDTMLVEALIDPPSARLGSAEANRYYKLDAVAGRYGVPGKAGDLKAMAKHYGGFDKIPLDNPDFLTYLRQDVALTRDVARFQFRPLIEDLSLRLYAEREHLVAAIAAQITLNGFRVDTDLLQKRVQEGREKRARLLEELHERFNLPRTDAKGNPYKAPQATKEGKLAIVTAFMDAGVPLDEFKAKAKSGAPDLSKEYMNELAETYLHNQRIVALAELVQDLNGIRSVYETALQYLANGRVHPAISLRQASGRWSVTKPGLTVIGKRSGRVTERDVFVADEGHVIVAVDLSQVDARAVAAHCQDPAYIAMFEPGADLHTWVATRLWGDPSRRQDAKVLAHGWNYNMGVASLSRHTGLTYEEAQSYDQFMRESFPQLVQWKRDVVDRGGNGELLDNGFGRRLRVDPDRAYTQAPALIGQGAARDLMMQGLLNLDPALHPFLRLQVHDEIVMSVPKEDAEDVAQSVKEAMTFPWAPPGKEIPIQIVAEASIGKDTWASAYEKK